MNLVTNPHFKFFAAIVIISALLLVPLSVARALGAIMYILKEFGLDVAARLFTRIILTRVQNSIVGKILKAGEGGVPILIQDWRQFSQKSQYRGEDIFRAMIADAALGADAQICQYMRSSLSNVFGAKSISGFNSSKYRIDSLQPFNLRNKCSLPSNLNVDVFRNDFTQGGWEAWGKLIQPQNNFYGVFADSMSELTKQRSFEEGIARSEAESGEGNASKKSNCQGAGPNRQCTIMGLVLTPGAVFSDAEKASINKELDWLISADELSEVIVNATVVLLDRLENFTAGKIISDTDKATGEPSYNAEKALERARGECMKECLKDTGCSLTSVTGECQGIWTDCFNSCSWEMPMPAP